MAKRDKRRKSKGARGGGGGGGGGGGEGDGGGGGGGLLMRMRGGVQSAAGIGETKRKSSKLGDVLMWIVTIGLGALALLVLAKRLGLFPSHK
jgi:hypothetical protein